MWWQMRSRAPQRVESNALGVGVGVCVYVFFSLCTAVFGVSENICELFSCLEGGGCHAQNGRVIRCVVDCCNDCPLQCLQVRALRWLATRLPIGGKGLS